MLKALSVSSGWYGSMPAIFASRSFCFSSSRSDGRDLEQDVEFIGKQALQAFRLYSFRDDQFVTMKNTQIDE